MRILTPSQVVVDTDVASFRFKNDSRSGLYRPHLADRQVILSFMGVAELQAWARERNWGAARLRRLAEYLSSFRVQHSDGILCDWWAAVRATARRSGSPISVSDAWIAATAVRYGLPLVTHNPTDYADVSGLHVITAQDHNSA